MAVSLTPAFSQRERGMWSVLRATFTVTAPFRLGPDKARGLWWERLSEGKRSLQPPCVAVPGRGQQRRRSGSAERSADGPMAAGLLGTLSFR